MKIRDYIECLKNNLKGRKNAGRSISVLLFIALFIFFIVNSMSDSINQALDKVADSPMARNLIIHVDEGGQKKKLLEESLKTDERVLDICNYYWEISVRASGIQKNEMDMIVETYTRAYEEYLCEGKIPEKGEVLVPQYMYGIGGGEYFAGSKLIGLEIKLLVTDREDNVTEYSYRVSGSYDNIYSVMGNNAILVYDEDMQEIYETSMTGVEKDLEEAMKAQNDYDKSHYIGFERQYYCAVTVREEKDKMDIISVIDGLDEDISVMQKMDMSQNRMDSILAFARFMGNILTMVLMVILFVDIAVVISNDIRRRKKEMAVYYVQGYTRWQISLIAVLEYWYRILKAYLFAVILSGIVLLLANYVIDHHMSMTYQIIDMRFAEVTLYSGIILVILTGCAGLYYVHTEVMKIKAVDELKMEG